MHNIYLSYNNNEQLIALPILPEEIEIAHDGQNTSLEVLGLGEITQQKLPKAFTVSIESNFPSYEYYLSRLNLLSSRDSSAVYQAYMEPSTYITTIETWRNLLRPIRLVWIGGNVEINAPVSIENFSYGEKAGDVGTIPYKLDLKEYTFYGQKKITLDPNTNKIIEEKPRADLKEVPQLYQVASGDTLASISHKLFGNDEHVIDLMRLNGLTSLDVVNGLPVGRKLRTS